MKHSYRTMSKTKASFLAHGIDARIEQEGTWYVVYSDQPLDVRAKLYDYRGRKSASSVNADDAQPGWCFNYYVSMMRQRWIPGKELGEPRLIEMACRARGWLPPQEGDVYTITEGDAKYEIRRVG